MTNTGDPDQRARRDAERMARLAAIQRLAADGVNNAAQAVKHQAPETPEAPGTGARVRARRRRWIAPAIGAVALVALIGAAVARFAPGFRGAVSSPPARTQMARVIMLPASAPLYCPSTPAWSPDGQRIAVLAQTQAPRGDGHCQPYATVVSANLVREYSYSVSGWSAVVVVIDASTGAILNHIPITDPAAALCPGIVSCFSWPTSLAWNPDGASIAVFTDLTADWYTASGAEQVQERAALDMVPASGSGASRLLVAKGRIQTPTNNVQTTNLYSPPLFEWDLTSGAGTFTDIHESAGLLTFPYAPAYQVTAGGHLEPLTAPAAGAASPWRVAALQLNGVVTKPSPNVQMFESAWAWSADGRYVIPNVTTSAYLNVPHLTQYPAQAYTAGMYQPPFVAAPSAAVVAAVRDTVRSGKGLFVASDARSGRVASFACLEDGDTGKLIVRASGSSQPLASVAYSFPLSGTSLGCPGDAGAITWSPDGGRLAMADIEDAQIVVWRVPR